MIKVSLTICLFLTIAVDAYASHDTVVNGHRYTYVEYYPNGKVKMLGNKNDTLKTGKWVYYKNDGTVLAKGNYKEGYKYGKWVYTDYMGKKYKIHWKKGDEPTESVYMSEGSLNINDSYVGENIRFY